MFGKESSPSFITKNKSFKTDVPGLYSLVAQKGAAATAAAVKAYLAAGEAERVAAKKAGKAKPAAVKKAG